jgi:hypothetical protein
MAHTEGSVDPPGAADGGACFDRIQPREQTRIMRCET